MAVLQVALKSPLRFQLPAAIAGYSKYRITSVNEALSELDWIRFLESFEEEAMAMKRTPSSNLMVDLFIGYLYVCVLSLSL